MDGKMAQVIGVEIGEAHLRIARADIEKKHLSFVYRGRKEKGNALKNQIFKILDKQKGYEGIGVSAPGLMNTNMGILDGVRNLAIRNMRIQEMFEKRYNVPVFLTNEAVASVIAEKLFGTGKDYRNIALLSMSTGIECGVILDDRVLLGKDGNAHEIGHCVIDANSELKCGCGRKGHWEAFCSGGGIPNFARLLLDTTYKRRDSALRKLKSISVSDVFRLASRDYVAKEVVKQIGRINVMGVANIIELYDPELIAVAGWVALENRKAVMDPIISGVRKYVGGLNRMPKITTSPLGEKVALYGAVADFL